MKQLPQTPEMLLSEAGITAEELGNDGPKLVRMHQRMVELGKQHPNDEAFQTKSREGIERTIRQLRKLIQEFKAKTLSKEQKTEKKQKEVKAKKEKSREVFRKVTEEIGPDLEKCRTALREYRKQVAATQGPKPKKTRITKLKERLLGLIALIPKEMKEDDQILDKTEDILLDTLHRLTDLWGMTRIHPAEKAIEEKFDNLEEKAKAS